MKWTLLLEPIRRAFAQRYSLTTLGLVENLPQEKAVRARSPWYTRNQRPDRTPHPLNVAGPFYSVKDGCIACGAPEAVAPSVIGCAFSHCFYRKQPQTAKELDEAILAMGISCIENLRYSGNDTATLTQLRDRGLSHLCDALEDGR